ncbi:MAG: M23 family metallopeptidase [Bacteroidales bacterium]|jgi:murein DD-endopeptidase MepM/ murein hydrolase activator NlpD|nr:M23 family metallopeptidase [Bacteroidales bacterium]MDY2935310.1 M23 family metallopeptidase [Candidatus Cryptobacteroides sp.]MCI2133725.1 M23 family metallopeptidase [Bacteroidales bacterium]MCI2135936.1 M23 family metallopeptidase [Bacteroidales bacterium]MCI5719638.1 M23 family metallopeptidase [Bacteroidales bacterium]
MSREKKEKRPIVNNFKLTLSDKDKGTDLKTVSFTRIQGLIAIITIIIVYSFLVISLFIYTPLKTFIPGYPDAETRREAIRNAIRIDSLETEITKWALYSENFARIIDGQEPLELDSLMEIKAKSDSIAIDPKRLDESRQKLKDEVTKADEFALKPAERRSLPIEGMHFFTPLKGVISQGYDKALHPYIDITAPENSTVMSVLDGTVISAGWSDEYGYTIQIQHEGDIISVYKHNQKLLKKVGDKVTAGMPIAIVGNTGNTSKGNHLHFELWHKGEAVDPTKYISF